jgi:hypothetical protein
VLFRHQMANRETRLSPVIRDGNASEAARSMRLVLGSTPRGPTRLIHSGISLILPT